MTQQIEILVIEDDPAVAAGLQAALLREDYAVTWKAAGQAGIAFACDRNPHLIILDVRLPDTNGFEVCRQLRRLGLAQPIVMLTVQSDEADKISGLEAGADDYVTKPFSLRELLWRVRAQLRRAYGELANADANLLFAADLVIDRAKGEAWRGRQALNLTPTEFRLLVYLAQHGGQALTRQQILDAVWGSGEGEGEKLVNVHIRRLREKVEIDPSTPTLILTVPGVGYRFAG